MAPNGEMLVTSYSRTNLNKPHKLRRPSTEGTGLQRAVSDLSFALSKQAVDTKLPQVAEVEEARCECCGMSEECTHEYAACVRRRFGGRWICGLCSEAVKAEMEKNGGKHEEALDAHMSVCVRFNRIGRTHPVLFQAEAVKAILKKCSTGGGGGARSAASSPREMKGVKKGSIARSSSCIPAITKEIDGQRKTFV